MKTVQPWSEQSPPISLVWTSFRTPNCPRLEPERLTRYYVKRLERLGHSVKLELCVSA
jgi:hypothetical protein